MQDFKTQDFKRENDEVLVNCLDKLGLKAEISGRNDINIFGKKVSGSAFKIKLGDKEGKGKRSLHHGTMLINIDLSNLKKYLNPNKLKLVSKGVDSVIARVTNI